MERELGCHKSRIGLCTGAEVGMDEIRRRGDLCPVLGGLHKGRFAHPQRRVVAVNLVGDIARGPDHPFESWHHVHDRGPR